MPLNGKAMTEAELEGVFDLLCAFLAADPFYSDSRSAYGDGGSEALRRALGVFLAQPELGFVWLVSDTNEVVGCCVVCYAISTAAGTVVAKLDDVCVAVGKEGRGIGTALVESLAVELRRRGVRRIDTSCHVANHRARHFYARMGFRPLNEERLALIL